MEVSTRRAAEPGKPASETASRWRTFKNGVMHFLESFGELRHDMDEARHTHFNVSAFHDKRR